VILEMFNQNWTTFINYIICFSSSRRNKTVQQNKQWIFFYKFSSSYGLLDKK
jgi:hypothetical protein